MSPLPQPGPLTSTVAEVVWAGTGAVLFLALVLAFSWLVVKRKPMALVVAGALVALGPSFLQVDRTWLLQRFTGDWLPVLLLGIAAGVVLHPVSRAVGNPGRRSRAR
jgi:hypothetical protein